MARSKFCLLLCIVHAASSGQSAGRGVISGRVVDAASGDPVRKAIVTVTWQGTPRAWATTQTDGAGRFSVEGLPPGKYDLRANKQGLGSAIYGANSVRELGDLVTLGDGENRGDLQLKFLRSASISGRVVEPDGDPVTGVMVTLMRSSHNLGERVLVTYQQTNTNDRGEYRFTPVDPGEYFLWCNPNVQRMMGIVHREFIVPQYFGGARESKDAMAVHIRGGDVLAGMDFHLTTEHPGPRGQSYSSPVGKDGSFSIDQVAPGEYLLNINPSPGGVFEKSIMHGDRDVLYKRIEIPPGASAPLNVVLSSNAATLTGEVDAGKRAGILLAPVGKWHTMARFYYSALADDAGKFKLSGVAPGKYKIFAVEKIATASFRTPESADLIDALGEEVDVAEGAKLDLHPKLIPESKAKELLKP